MEIQTMLLNMDGLCRREVEGVNNKTRRIPSPVHGAFVPSFPDHLTLAAVDKGLGGYECPFRSTGARSSRSAYHAEPEPLQTR